MAIFSKLWRCGLVLVFILTLESCTSSTEDNKVEVTVSTSYSGEQLYQQNCVQCHGSDGNLGISDAADLTLSIKSKEEKIAFIKNGSPDGVMKPYAIKNGGYLTDEEIEKIASYIEEF